MPRYRRRRLARQRRKHGVASVWKPGLFRALIVHHLVAEGAVGPGRAPLSMIALGRPKLPERQRELLIRSVAFMPRSERKKAERMPRKAGA